MKRNLIVTGIVFLSSIALWAQQSLPIQRIHLYKNGMAYVVRSGEIQGPARLSFHPDELNDVLKTFTAWNPETGNLYSLGYTTGIPSQQILSRFPFELRAEGAGMADFLGQVKGAPVRLVSRGQSLLGRLLAVHPVRKTAEGQILVEDYEISLLEDSGKLVTVALSDVQSLKMEDEQLQSQLQAYLTVLAEGSQDITKEISIYPSPSAGPVRAAYLQQFPVWKTTYRLQFEGQQAYLEGWALIDNPTGEAWQDVELTLISGMPVSFEMDLYQPLYASRSQVPVPGSEVAAPRIYEGAVQDEFAIRSEERSRLKLPEPQAQPRSSLPLNSRSQLDMAAVSTSAFEAAPSGEFVQAEAGQLRDYFEYRFPFPIRLESRQSALLPFMKTRIDAERVSIYNPQTDGQQALNGARLKNSSSLPLEAGPITIFERNKYAGESVLSYTARNDNRLISFGVDFEILVSGEAKVEPESITGVKIANGIATQLRERVRTTQYLLSNKAKSEKTLIIEHPRQPGQELKGAEPLETTANYYRFQLKLEPEEQRSFGVPEVLSRRTTLSLGNADARQIQLFFSGWRIPPQLQAKLDEIVRVQAQVNRQGGERDRIRGEISAISEDQARIRQNLEALAKSREETALRSRYLSKLTEQEDQLEALRTQLRQVETQLQEAGRELQRLIEALEWEA